MKTDSEIDTIFRTLLAEREAAIEELMLQDKRLPRVVAAIIHDAEKSPRTTNGKMLAMIGIDPDTANLSDLIHGLAKWGIFLVNTNHLTDDELHDRVLRVLGDEVSLIPPNPELSEFIDLGTDIWDTDANAFKPHVSNRDDYLPRPAIRDDEPTIRVHI